MVDLITLPTVQFHVCSNGEIVEPNTGIVVDFVDYSPEIPLSTDTRTLIRHWDGMSAEPLGSIPKIIAFSKAEQHLLSKLRPWKFLKYAVNQDYLELIDKINKQRLSLYRSIYMKVAWADPNSALNSPEYRGKISNWMKNAWADPDSVYNSPEYRGRVSNWMKVAWADPNSILNSQICRDKMSVSMKIAWADPNSALNSQTYRDKISNRMKVVWADSNSVYRRNVSIKTAQKRANPTSVYNSDVYHINHLIAVRKAWKNPIALENKSVAITASWIKRRIKFGHSGFSKEGLLRVHRPGQKKPQIWLTRLKRYGPRGVKNPEAHSKNLTKGLKNRWAWWRLAQAMEMLFGNIVDEDAETFPCPHCNRVFPSKIGIGQHIVHAHAKLEDLDEFELQSYQSMIWSYHTNGYTGLTRAQKRSLKHSGLIDHKPGRKNQISLSRLGIDVLSTINDTNTPLLRL